MSSFPSSLWKGKICPYRQNTQNQWTYSVLRMEAHGLPRALTFHAYRAFFIPGLQPYLFYFPAQPEFLCVEGGFDRKAGLLTLRDLVCRQKLED